MKQITDEEMAEEDRQANIIFEENKKNLEDKRGRFLKRLQQKVEKLLTKTYETHKTFS